MFWSVSTHECSKLRLAHYYPPYCMKLINFDYSIGNIQFWVDWPSMLSISNTFYKMTPILHITSNYINRFPCCRLTQSLFREINHPFQIPPK